jgi:hypothetical protein
MGPRKKAKKTKDTAVDDAREAAVPETETEVVAAEDRDEPTIVEESEETAAPTPDEVIASAGGSPPEARGGV